MSMTVTLRQQTMDILSALGIVSRMVTSNTVYNDSAHAIGVDIYTGYFIYHSDFNLDGREIKFSNNLYSFTASGSTMYVFIGVLEELNLPYVLVESEMWTENGWVSLDDDEG